MIRHLPTFDEISRSLAIGGHVYRVSPKERDTHTRSGARFVCLHVYRVSTHTRLKSHNYPLWNATEQIVVVPPVLVNVAAMPITRLTLLGFSSLALFFRAFRGEPNHAHRPEIGLQASFPGSTGLHARHVRKMRQNLGNSDGVSAAGTPDAAPGQYDRAALRPNSADINGLLSPPASNPCFGPPAYPLVGPTIARVRPEKTGVGWGHHRHSPARRAGTGASSFAEPNFAPVRAVSIGRALSAVTLTKVCYVSRKELTHAH